MVPSVRVLALLLLIGCGSALANIVIPVAITASAINVSATCSRQSGVSPLSIVCSAVGTTSSATTAPFHEIQYSWNFGDTNTTPAGTCGDAPVAGEGFWRCGSNPGANSKNTAKGPIAAHTYEITEGGGTQTFTVTMTAYDGTNTATQTQTITVTDPASVYAGALTTCFANNTTYTGCPAGATQTGNQSSFDLTTCTVGRRCLWKRGDTYTSTAQTMAAVGPVTLGAYGSGAQPIISRTTETQTAINLSSVNVNDLRIMDLEIKGASTQATDSGACLTSSANVSGVTLLRLSCHDIGKAIVATGNNVFSRSVIQDSNLYNIYATSGGVGFFGGLTRSAIQGNSVGPFATSGEHNVRVQPGNVVTVANNTMTTPGTSGKSNFTLRAGEHITGAGTYANQQDSQYVHIADNKMIAGAGASIETFQIGPASNSQNNWIYDTISERNWLTFGSVTQRGFHGQSSNATVRDNICDASGGAAGRNCFNPNPTNTAGAPVPDNNRFYNNTCYASDASTSAQCVYLDGSTVAITNAVVYNNLAYFPNATTARTQLKSGTVGSTPSCTTACANNSSDAQAKSTDPLFTSVSPFNPTNAKPQGASYAVGAGTSVPVWSDFFGTAWSPTWSLGAVHP